MAPRTDPTAVISMLLSISESGVPKSNTSITKATSSLVFATSSTAIGLSFTGFTVITTLAVSSNPSASLMTYHRVSKPLKLSVGV